MCTLASPRLRISFVLVIFSVLFSLIKCAPTVASRYDDFDWKPFTWKPFTWDPIDWKKITISPGDSDYSSSSNFDAGLLFLIVLPPVIIYVIIVVCKEYCCKESNSSTYASSNTTLHAPPRNSPIVTRRVAEPARVHRPQLSNRREGTQFAFSNLMTDFSSNSSLSNFGQISNNNPPNNSTLSNSDRPPDYGDVVFSDLSEPETKFPTTNPKPVETPPPNYNAENIPKF